MSIILTSFTPLNDSGGVPKWNRDFVECFPGTKHYSAFDVPGFNPNSMTEWESAKVLTAWLKHTKKIKKEDLIIGDGFWVDGLSEFPNVISVCHGNWGHLIKEEADVGLKPDFPFHHAAQIDFRKRFIKEGKRLVAVSEFISHQMKIQWGFESVVVNNAIDLNKLKPWPKQNREKLLILHGINDKNNGNKGWFFIEKLIQKYSNICDFYSLDEFYSKMSVMRMNKYECLSKADYVVIPSGHEGNSYFALECLALNLPVMAYNVGLFWELWLKNSSDDVGLILDRQKRSVEHFCENFAKLLENKNSNSRKICEQYDIKNFKQQWENLIKQYG